MSLQKQNVSISFSQGLDTKTDPNQVVVGKLLNVQNVVFSEGMAFNKRNGYQLLSTLTQSQQISTFKNELISFDGSHLNSYSPTQMNNVSKGSIVSVDVSTQAIFRSTTQQTIQDSAFNPFGLYLFVWVDSVNGAQYSIYSSTTGNQIVSATSLVATAKYPRAFSMGNYLIITYVDTATNNLMYVSIPILNPTTASSPTSLSSLVHATNNFYDGIVFNNSLYLSWNGSDGGGAVRSTYLDAFLNQHNTQIQSGESASQVITTFSDSSNSQIWVAYYNGSVGKVFVLNSSNLQNVLNPTTVGSSGGVFGSTLIALNGYANNGVANLYWETSNTYSYSSTRSDFINTLQVTNLGTVNSNGNFLRSIGITSKWFSVNNTNYMVVSYGGSLQPTYFVVDSTGLIIAKLAYANGGGYSSSGTITSVNQITQNKFQFAYLFKDLLDTQTGQVYTQVGVNSAFLDFSNTALYETEQLGNNLNVTGGYGWAYDGATVTEQNFHIFPEDFAATASTGVGPSNLAANTYSYVPLYEWMDNQGNIHRSGYGTPLSVAIGGASSGITVSIPTLRLTSKSNVALTLYRTAPSVATNIYYRVSSITSPTLNDKTVDSLTITDTNSDASITGNALLYTTGGVVQDSGSPAASGLTIFKNRLFLIESEDRNTLWFSKETLQGTPVEMSQSFTLYIDPRFGAMTALAVMDDKLIIFKNNSIFYLVGNGPDSTGSNNDFTDPNFITSVVGCANARSIVLTQDGLMFQSNKGIWLLSRGLEVSYIGAPVEEFNSYSVSSANVVPNTTQVRFTISNGTALVYDYFYKQWAIFTNHSASGAVIFQNLYTYLSTNGKLLQETIGSYTDNGVPVYMSLQTSWVSLAGFQGFLRAYRLFLKSQFLTPHILNVSVAYDYNPNSLQTSVIQPTSLANSTWGSGSVWGDPSPWGGNYQNEQYRINLTKQKCQAIQIYIQEAIDTTNVVYGGGLTLEAIGVVVGSKSTYPRLPATQAVSG